MAQVKRIHRHTLMWPVDTNQRFIDKTMALSTYLSSHPNESGIDQEDWSWANQIDD